MKIGYARVSTLDQNPDLQKDALEKTGCEKVIVDQISGTVAQRPGLEKVKELLRRGDTLVVWRLDRLGRSMKHLVKTVTGLGERGVGFRSLTEGVNTTTTGGTLVFHLFGALAQFERDLIIERTQAGLEAAAARGRKGGRKPVVTPKKIEQAKAHIRDGLTVREAAARLKISKTSLYTALRDQKTA